MPPVDLESAALVRCFERCKLALNAWAVAHFGNAHVNFSKRLSGNYICLGAPAGYSDTHGKSALEVSPVAYGFDNTPKFPQVHWRLSRNRRLRAQPLREYRCASSLCLCVRVL